MADGVVLDVGANIGQTVKRLKTEGYAPAAIHCFEPCRASYGTLVGNHPDVNAHRVALGDKPGEAKLTNEARPSCNRISPHGVELVTVVTGDGWCADNGIDRVRLLKVDAEGYDLKVLVGFGAMLRDKRATLVRVEAGMNPGNRTHVSLRAFLDHLEPLGYWLERIDEMVAESRGGVMRRADLTFRAV